MGIWIIISLLLIPVLICILAAIYLCAKGREGWGWFLFVAFCLVMSQGQVIKWLSNGFGQ